jgi:endonuclease/exonuclease/phosphatase family metal-dependent hydrolase
VIGAAGIEDAERLCKHSPVELRCRPSHRRVLPTDMSRITQNRFGHPKPSAPSAIKVMSFNIRVDTFSDVAAGNQWVNRADSVIATVRRFAPDVIGFQEALSSQLDELIEAFPSHQAVGSPRQEGDLGEYVPILFSRRRLKAEAYGDFWLSPTPDVSGSTGWDAVHPRHCSWVQLLDRMSRRRWIVFNTHLDHRGAVARLEAARIIIERAIVAPGLPTLVLGDLNADETSEPLRAFYAAGLRDTFRDVYPDERDVQTAHHYLTKLDARKIDYILCDGRWEVLAAEIVREPASGRLPSDHFPVVAELRERPIG